MQLFREKVARHACYLSFSFSLLLAVIKNPRVTFYRCSTVVSLLVSCGSVSWISCLVAFRNSATGTPSRVWGTGLAGGDGVSRPESVWLRGRWEDWVLEIESILFRRSFFPYRFHTWTRIVIACKFYSREGKSSCLIVIDKVQILKIARNFAISSPDKICNEFDHGINFASFRTETSTLATELHYVE